MIEIRKCKKCEIEKEIYEFHKQKLGKNGFRSVCKSCRSTKKIIEDKAPAGYKTCNKCKKEKLILNFRFRNDTKKYRNTCIECKNKIDKEYNSSHKEEKKIKDKEWREKNKDKKRKNDREYQLINKEKIKKYSVIYRIKNKDNLRVKNNIREKNRRNTDPNFKLLKNIRCLIRNSLKMNYKSNTTKNLLGCDIDFLREYLLYKLDENDLLKNLNKTKNQFDWLKDHGRESYHIDHIRPCCSFDLSDPKQQEEYFHYTNLQLLWWTDNISKGGKV